jgi:sRNA-binding protein
MTNIYDEMVSPRYAYMAYERWMATPLAQSDVVAAQAAWDRRETRLATQREKNRLKMRGYRERKAAKRAITPAKPVSRQRSRAKEKRVPVSFRIDKAVMTSRINVRLAAVEARTGKEAFISELCEGALLALLELDVADTVAILKQFTRYGDA